MTTPTTAPTATVAAESVERAGAYTLSQILGIWAAAALTMGVLGWLVAPAFAPDIRSDPIRAVAVRMGVLTLGLVWLFVLSMILVRREEGNLRWATIRRRLRLNTPRDPVTGEPRGRLWLWAILFVALTAMWEFTLSPAVSNLWVSVFPWFAEPQGFALGSVLESPEVQARMVGAWWLLALFVVNALFNSILGEEFLFRGVLLPRMKGVFGKADWIANGLLFGVYHLHQPWGILESVISGIFLYAFPAMRYRSTWMSIIVHSGQSVYFLFLMLGLVLGLA